MGLVHIFILLSNDLNLGQSAHVETTYLLFLLRSHTSLGIELNPLSSLLLVQFKVLLVHVRNFPILRTLQVGHGKHSLDA